MDPQGERQPESGAGASELTSSQDEGPGRGTMVWHWEGRPWFWTQRWRKGAEAHREEDFACKGAPHRGGFGVPPVHAVCLWERACVPDGVGLTPEEEGLGLRAGEWGVEGRFALILWPLPLPLLRNVQESPSWAQGAEWEGCRGRDKDRPMCSAPQAILTFQPHKWTKARDQAW